MNDAYQDEINSEQATLERAYGIVKEEINACNVIASKYRAEMERLRGDYERLPDFQYARSRANRAETEAEKMKSWLQSLYFGRIDFHHEGEHAASTYYIAKLPDIFFSARDKCKKAGIMILDWRAPVASLFYSRANSYIADGVKHKGELMLVRHLAVKQDKVLSIHDFVNKRKEQPLKEQVAGLDPVLKRQIERYGGDRFKDIVQTIQADQNRLIRYPFDKHLVIQGGAGTGKTIVLLHRVAYCLYITRCAPEDILVLTPHRMLLEQISDILPDLHVHNVPQLTLEEFFKRVTEKSIQLKPVSALSFEDSVAQNVRKYSNWITQIKLVLDEIVNKGLEYVHSRISDLERDGQILIPGSEIKQFLERDEIRELSYERQRSKLLLWLKRNLYNKLSGSNISDEDMVRESLKKAQTLAASYIKTLPSVQEFYWKRLLRMYLDYTSGFRAFVNTKAEVVPIWSIDDMGALLYLYLRSYDGVGKKYRFIFVDEAHNLSPIWLLVLKEFLTAGGTLTLAGDIYQTPISVWGNLLANGKWDWLIEALEPNVAVETLTISYRSTQAIVEEAKRAITEAFPEAGEILQGVRPSSDSVIQMASLQEFVDFVRSDSREIRTAAIISPTRERAENVRKELVLQLQNLHMQRELVILSIEETGGLEFDAVLIDEFDFYDCKNPAHARALYTAISRATHYLCILKGAAASSLR